MEVQPERVEAETETRLSLVPEASGAVNEGRRGRRRGGKEWGSVFGD